MYFTKSPDPKKDFGFTYIELSMEILVRKFNFIFYILKLYIIVNLMSKIIELKFFKIEISKYFLFTKYCL